MGQQTIESNSVSVKLPNEMEKLNKVEVSSFAKRKFNNDRANFYQSYMMFVGEMDHVTYLLC